MKKIIIAALVLASVMVASGADITIRQIRDPVKFQAWIASNISDVSGVATNIAGSSIVSGNIAVARITNAASTVGASIGGNIPVAALTNALAGSIGTYNVTNSFTSGTNVNTIIVLKGLVTSWTTGN